MEAFNITHIAGAELRGSPSRVINIHWAPTICSILVQDFLLENWGHTQLLIPYPPVPSITSLHFQTCFCFLWGTFCTYVCTHTHTYHSSMHHEVSSMRKTASRDTSASHSLEVHLRGPDVSIGKPKWAEQKEPFLWHEDLTQSKNSHTSCSWWGGGNTKSLVPNSTEAQAQQYVPLRPPSLCLYNSPPSTLLDPELAN